jgi:NADH-quinone oxidoreductase subunit F
MGTPARVVIDELAGGVLDGKRLKAWTPGGSSTPFLTDAHLDVGLDFESIQEAGSLLGTGALIVTDERDCMVDATRRLLRFYAHESCGKCTPCREGTWWVERVLDRIENGFGREEDLPLLADVGDNMLFKAFCALADGAVSPISSTLTFFRDEYEAHVRERRCPFKDPAPGIASEERRPATVAAADAESIAVSEVLG